MQVGMLEGMFGLELYACNSTIHARIKKSISSLRMVIPLLYILQISCEEENDQ